MTVRMRAVVIGLAAVVLIVAAGVVWVMFPPGAMKFAGGRPVALADYSGPSPVSVPAEMRDASLVERGKYLTQAADCEACHTAKDGQPYVGGRAFRTPFGTLYSPNITPDRETGIGAWSDADFLRAVHKGIAKNGSYLYPAFPYESYTLLVDDDVLAIKAYLFSLTPVHAAAPPNALAFPFNQRWLMFFWSLFYNPDTRFRPNLDRSPEWNRGAYLVEALAHCGDCHTPRNLGQALDNRNKFAGAIADGWRAYNITSDHDSGVGAWTEGQLASYIQTGHSGDHGSAGGPMAEAVDISLTNLTGADVQAMVTYLRSIPPIRTPDLPAPKPVPASDSPKVMEASFDPHGKRVFESACASCHSWSGRSLLTTDATLVGVRAVNDETATNVIQIVLNGAQRPAPALSMPAFGRGYTDEEIAAVANYITGRFGTKASTVTAAEVTRLRLP